MSSMNIRGLTKRFDSLTVVKGVDLSINDRELVVIVGPSGCGKSTLLRMMAGLESITEGELTIDGVRMNEVRAADRGIAMVFQNYALYPHKTVEQNMGFSLRIAKLPKAQIRAKVMAAAEILQLTDFLKRYPKELSGGQRQRVAIGRAIVRDPKIFLFDEPLSNLDAGLRLQMRIELARLHQELEATMIYVTHDQVEAMTLADKIVVLRDGSIEQIGAPLDIYRKPANSFVASFIGSPKMNLLEARVESVHQGIAHVACVGLTIDIATTDSPVAGSNVTFGIRPEHFQLATGDSGLAATLLVCERLGGLTYAYCKLPDGQDVTIQLDGEYTFEPGGVVRVIPNAERGHVFSSETGLRL